MSVRTSLPAASYTVNLVALGFKSMLVNNDIEVSVAKNGEEGIEKAIETKPDCILMDVVMPGKNGFQATRDLSRNPETSTIPVIIITTKDQETDKIWGMRQGAKDYIVKPADERDLIERINKVMGFDRDYEE